MLAKNRRIPRKLFKPLLESKQYFNSEHFALRVALSHETRVAVSVSKKISKKAVVRNKIRRRVYSIMGDLVSSLHAGLYLIMAKSGSAKIKEKALENELRLLVVSCQL